MHLPGSCNIVFHSLVPGTSSPLKWSFISGEPHTLVTWQCSLEFLYGSLENIVPGKVVSRRRGSPYMSQLYSTAAASLLSFKIVSVIPDVLVLNTVLNNTVSGNTLFNNITMFNKHCSIHHSSQLRKWGRLFYYAVRTYNGAFFEGIQKKLRSRWNIIRNAPLYVLPRQKK